MTEEIVTRFADGRLLVDYNGAPQANYSTGGVSHTFNKLARVLKTLLVQVEGTSIQCEAVEYGTSNVIKVRMYHMTGNSVELPDAGTITPLTLDIRVIGY